MRGCGMEDNRVDQVEAWGLKPGESLRGGLNPGLRGGRGEGGGRGLAWVWMRPPRMKSELLEAGPSEELVESVGASQEQR